MPSSSFTLTILVALVATPLIASFSPIKPFSLVILPRAGIRPTHAPTSDPSAAVADVSSPSALDAKRNEPEEEEGSGPFGFVSDFFSALDDFVDDATSRRLGNGAKFYGKRKSGFYGKDDSMKKSSRGANFEEDYQGPTGVGYFQWKRNEETGEVQAVTKMKGKVIEKRREFWRKDDD